MEGGSLARTWLLGLMVIAAAVVATAGSTYYNLHEIWKARQSATAARQWLDAIKAFRIAQLDVEFRRRISRSMAMPSADSAWNSPLRTSAPR